MIKTSRQLKDLIRNLAKDKAADAQVLMRNYMMERFLERLSLSAYKNNFILKGGMLVSALVGVKTRSTMDMDVTIKGITVNAEKVEAMINEIISVSIKDGVIFQLKNITGIMDEAEYPGIRVSLEAEFDHVVTPLKIDISTGDAITPCEIQYDFSFMLEKRKIQIWTYNLETLLAEKIETIISRSTTNTRMRDFYDVYILSQLYMENISLVELNKAIIATSKNRGTEEYLGSAMETFEEIENNKKMAELWSVYQKNYSYASNLNWLDVVNSVKKLYKQTQN